MWSRGLRKSSQMFAMRGWQGTRVQWALLFLSWEEYTSSIPRLPAPFLCLSSPAVPHFITPQLFSDDIINRNKRRIHTQKMRFSISFFLLMMSKHARVHDTNNFPSFRAFTTCWAKLTRNWATTRRPKGGTRPRWMQNQTTSLRTSSTGGCWLKT